MLVAPRQPLEADASDGGFQGDQGDAAPDDCKPDHVRKARRACRPAAGVIGRRGKAGLQVGVEEPVAIGFRGIPRIGEPVNPYSQGCSLSSNPVQSAR